MTHKKIKWKCPYCEDIVTSDSREQHKMDYCKCEKTACDLEEHYCRWMTDQPEKIKEMIIENNRKVYK